MATEKKSWLSAVALGLILVLLACSLFYTWKLSTAPAVVVPSAKDIAAEIKIPVAPVVNNTATTVTVVDPKDTWETKALDLAKTEIKTREVYNFLTDNGYAIDVKTDITEIRFVEEDVRHADYRNEDAEVTYQLKVYYENSDGDEKKVTLDAKVSIVDGEVDEVTYELA
jgi:hypothetical protein